MSKEQEIRSKIVSIKNTQKIARAMELVSVSKMRKAQNRMITSRPYNDKIRKVISHITKGHIEYTHPYMTYREITQRIGYVIISTDRGLCGGLNINLFRMSLTEMYRWQKKNVEIDLCIIGRKGENFFQRRTGNIIAISNRLGDTPRMQDIIGIVKVILDRFNEKKIDAVYIACNTFVSSLVQKPIIYQLLPVITNEKIKETADYWDYIYEPDSSKDLLETLLVRYIESQVYQAIIENIACEHSARRIAMKNATENSKRLIDELQFIRNKARQAYITQEIIEIISGTEAIVE
ncbi:F0F1 ATP synthase subunit gamma [Coxiella endosymbiont of Amblyomma americanum]|uniref:F0F1 ATP synthase subunit gamma n=1 Tax=Coxiella endosymbiont of Amblyomma americanum TaxID=325775 RepID=UPI00057EBE84|nr:F0F1 ATP synthase subunit gamma [Coxiella endosymbiont of Amblyomma americanum]AJC50160.1 ATP F0F1 synthase subunit gamma [Coxiella endosymbiont of Amblyomma americanum]AUJ58519.1 F0F1 ATP synthase subunit gamma [Coxiella-like endosymbiont of Amblyomma americanum]